MFIATLFVIAQVSKQPKRLSTGELISNHVRAIQWNITE